MLNIKCESDKSSQSGFHTPLLQCCSVDSYLVFELLLVIIICFWAANGCTCKHLANYCAYVKKQKQTIHTYNPLSDHSSLELVVPDNPAGYKSTIVPQDKVHL